MSAMRDSEADIRDASEFGDNNSALGSQMNVLKPVAIATVVNGIPSPRST